MVERHWRRPLAASPLWLMAARGLFSFGFNVGEGEGAYCKSTLVHKANTGDMLGACAELSRLAYAGGKQLPGLVQRRAAELRMCGRLA